ncbi:diadenylate cyclase CdaA [bacterium]|nr:diadenylate cyclase CdaA [bacterium]
MSYLYQLLHSYFLNIQHIDFRWQDAFEILILTFIIYRIIYILKGTLAVHILGGLLFLIGFFIFAEIFEMRTIKWLLQNFWSVWFLLIIIILQPELRRMLAFTGKYGVFRKIKLLEVETISAIVQAITSLSEKHNGALIVIERETGLRTYQESGVRIDAAVTPELLMNIFNPETNLHDGAVIINNDRIASSCCYLPLSKNPQLVPSIGTRHRAAIGITEETDAVVVVVSEETGIISVAIEGEIKRKLSPSDVENFLSLLFLKDNKVDIKKSGDNNISNFQKVENEKN